jgi:hypothetical protein
VIIRQLAEPVKSLAAVAVSGVDRFNPAERNPSPVWSQREDDTRPLSATIISWLRPVSVLFHEASDAHNNPPGLVNKTGLVFFGNSATTVCNTNLWRVSNVVSTVTFAPASFIEDMVCWSNSVLCSPNMNLLVMVTAYHTCPGAQGHRGNQQNVTFGTLRA